MKFSRQTTLRRRKQPSWASGVHSGLPVSLTIGPASSSMQGFSFVRTSPRRPRPPRGSSHRERIRDRHRILPPCWATARARWSPPRRACAGCLGAAWASTTPPLKSMARKIPIMDGSSAAFVDPRSIRPVSSPSRHRAAYPGVESRCRSRWAIFGSGELRPHAAGFRARGRD